MSGKGDKIEYPFRFKPEEMGIVSGDSKKKIFLTESFLRNKMGVSLTSTGTVQKGNHRLTHVSFVLFVRVVA